MKINDRKLQTGIMVLLGVVTFLFVLKKAWLTSFTHDESFSYLNYCGDSFMEIISFSNWYTNNHILNSLLMKYSGLLFGPSEIALRLPNILLLGVYMLYAALLFKDRNPVIAIAVFTLLISNDILISLFGLARGYGLSFGFMIMSLYHFTAFLKKKKNKDLILFHLAALLGSLSNFTILTFYLSIIIVYNIYSFLYVRFIAGERYKLFAVNKVHILPFIVVGIVLYEPVRRAIFRSKMDFGGTGTFYQDTVRQVIYNLSNNYWLPRFLIPVIMVVITLLVVFGLYIIIKRTVKKDHIFFDKHTGLIVNCLLLIIISIVIVSQHLILGNDYPIGRFSAFLIPPLFIFLGYLMDYLMTFLRYKKIIALSVSGLALLSLISFWSQADLHYYEQWKYDRNTRKMIQTLAAEQEGNHQNDDKVKLCANWLFEPTSNFYRVTNDYVWLQPVDRTTTYMSADYCYILEDELDQLEACSYKIIERYPSTNSVLIKIKNR